MFPALKTGDFISFAPLGNHVCPMIIAPMPLQGNAARMLIDGKPACVMGDELPPPLKSPIPYMAPPYVIPGMGILDLKLPPSHLSKIYKVDGKPLLIMAGPFEAKFNVTVPAMQPPPGPAPPIPDSSMTKKFLINFIPVAPLVLTA